MWVDGYSPPSPGHFGAHGTPFEGVLQPRNKVPFTRADTCAQVINLR